MIELTTAQIKRINALKKIQEKEIDNNFQNGDLWNEIEDIIYNLTNFGQEDRPTPILKNGMIIGYKYEKTRVYFEGMNFND